MCVNAAAAWFIRRPGYMDAYYYFGGAKRLIQGYGFTEPYLWNYLDDPAGLPHASHLYWMPLPSLVAAGPMFLCMRAGACPDNASLFRAGQVPSVLLASLLPVISYFVAEKIEAGRKGGQDLRRTSQFRFGFSSWAALFTISSGYYLVFWPNTDAFALYGVVGSLALLCASLGVESPSMRWFALAGVFAGLGHLSRADGVLLLLAILLVACLAGTRAARPGIPNFPRFFGFPFAAILGYLLVMLPWFVRNLSVSGSLLAPGGTKALWFVTYNDVFGYPAQFSAATYLAAGWAAILAGKWEAVTTNLQTAVAVHGLIVLAPFIVVGLWSLRRKAMFGPAILYALGLYFTMTFVFTFPGTRGGLFHSGAALLPFYFAAAPFGLERVVAWVAAHRRAWHAPTATRVFLAGLAVIVTLLTGAIYTRRVLGPNWPELLFGNLGNGAAQPAWNQSDEAYAQIGAWLVAAGDHQSIVAVNNPPGFHYFTDHPAIVIPNGDLGTLLAVRDRYGATWVVVDANVPSGLDGFYARRESSRRLRLAAEFSDSENRPVYLYEVVGRGS